MTYNFNEHGNIIASTNSPLILRCKRAAFASKDGRQAHRLFPSFEAAFGGASG